MSKIDLYKGDCLTVMDELIAKGVVVDAIITDPPYGTTACKWDSVIPFDEMWQRLNKLIKPNGAIVLFGSEPFSSALRMSNIKNYKYDWVWKKNNATLFQHAKKMPLCEIEQISVFAKIQPTYNPQGLIPLNKINKRGSMGNNLGKGTNNEYMQTHTNYPRRILEYSKDGKLHSTQKPVALMEYLIKTYTNEGELVLDFTAGSGTTPVACDNTCRGCIAIENNDGYFDIMTNRVAENKKRIEDTEVGKGLIDE